MDIVPTCCILSSETNLDCIWSCLLFFKLQLVHYTRISSGDWVMLTNNLHFEKIHKKVYINIHLEPDHFWIRKLKKLIIFVKNRKITQCQAVTPFNLHCFPVFCITSEFLPQFCLLSISEFALEESIICAIGCLIQWYRLS